MAVLFPRGLPFGFMGESSNDRSQCEQEVVVLRWLGGNGKPYNRFHDLAQLDLKESADGRPPDAKAIKVCYAKSFAELDQYEGFLHLSSWKQAAVGASVMLGSQGGVAKLIKDDTLTTIVVIHGVAHVEQLGVGDAFDPIEYNFHWRRVIQDLYLEYSGSGKKQFDLDQIAKLIAEKLLKVQGTHGIRWVASMARTIKAVLHNLPAMVVDLEVTAKSACGVDFTVITPSENIVKKTFKQKFNFEGGCSSTWKAVVRTVKPSADGITASDEFDIYYPGDKSSIDMPKAELVARLTDEDASGLVKEPRWLLRMELTDFRFVGFTAFMLDIHEILGILSKSYQSNSLTIFDVGKNLNKSLRALEKLLERPGANEAAFLEAVELNDAADCLRTCQLYEDKEGRSLLKSDKVEVVAALKTSFLPRFEKVLEDPVLNAMAAFDHRRWSPTKDVLQFSYDSDIKFLYNAYSNFYKSEETKEMVLEQSEDLKMEIFKSDGLLSAKFHDLWARMLVQYSDEYPLVLRLVVIALLIPADMSECERIFSLMNDIKTSERESVGQDVLRNLMHWHIEGKEMAIKDVPVMSILKEWRSMATGPKGRAPHRPADPPR